MSALVEHRSGSDGDTSVDAPTVQAASHRDGTPSGADVDAAASPATGGDDRREVSGAGHDPAAHDPDAGDGGEDVHGLDGYGPQPYDADLQGPGGYGPGGYGPAGRPAPGADALTVAAAGVVRGEETAADPAMIAAELRRDFGAHLEHNYQRLVAQLFAITLEPRAAHGAVQDAYSRAWREWATISRTPDPTGWIRRVAVRSTIRSWREFLVRVGIGRPQPFGEGVDERTTAMLSALARLPAAERRCVVLSHMVGVPVEEIAALEQVSLGTVQARLYRARHVVIEGMADVLPAVLGLPEESYDPAVSHDGDTYVHERENW